MMPDFIHMGQPCNFAKLLHHYRAQMHREPQSVSFWRDRARVIIADRREQLSAWRIAA